MSRAKYAIGDIHGRYDLLEALLEHISNDAEAHRHANPLLVFCGDYIDRGPESDLVLDRVAGDHPGFDVIRLMGNHEQMMLEFLRGAENDLSVGFVSHGLATLKAYGFDYDSWGDAAVDYRRLMRELPLRMPQRVRAMLDNLALSHQEDGYLFVHAGIRPGLALAEQSANDLLWIRHEFLAHPAPCPGLTIIHGHTPVREPEILPHRINLDTRAYHSGVLTAAVLDDGPVRLIQTGMEETRNAA